MVQFATLAGGCFWCTEAIFKRLKGIISVTNGYAGGKGENPTYEEVSGGNTGFAESIQIKFNPETIPFEHLLDIFWVIHDPTTLNHQGSDIGTQYRSIIFYQNEEQKEVALKSKKELDKSRKLTNAIVTEIIPLEKFYSAEEYHQNYYERNRNTNPYCLLIINPKIQKLLDKFNNDVKEEYKKKL